jgi:hypothetical protein
MVTRGTSVAPSSWKATESAKISVVLGIHFSVPIPAAILNTLLAIPSALPGNTDFGDLDHLVRDSATYESRRHLLKLIAFRSFSYLRE